MVETAVADCLPAATHKYSHDTCNIRVNRAIPGSPLPVVVPKGTAVQVIVQNRTPFETIQITQSLDALPAQDFGLAIAKLFSPGISAITVRGGGHFSIPSNEYEIGQQVDAANALQRDQEVLTGIADEVANFRKGDSAGVAVNRCIPDPTTPDQNYNCAKQALIADIAAIKTLSVPVNTVQLLDMEITARVNACNAMPTSLPLPAGADPDDLTDTSRAEQQRQACLAIVGTLEERQVVLHTALAEVQDKMAAMLALGKALASLQGSGEFVARIVGSVNKKATIKVAAKDASSGTSTDIATVVVSWQGSNFALSTGLLLSTLPNRVYSNTPIVLNGVPVLDSGGKVTTVVTENETRPSVVTPLAMLNYEFTQHNYANGKFGVLVSGGLGANLTTKTADYAVGFSLRFRELLFSPLLHLGRETYLSNGVAVGQKLGSSPPTLTTEQHFKPAVGFAISYRIPVP
jgi:hypothetical protein